MSWTQPQCESCWVKANPGRAPVRFVEAEAEMCCECGERTTAGIYIRVDPRTVPYPRTEES